MPTEATTQTAAQQGANRAPTGAETAAMFGTNAGVVAAGPGEGDPNAKFPNLLEQQTAAANAQAAAANAKAENEPKRIAEERQAQLTAEQKELQDRFQSNCIAHPLFFTSWQTAKFNQDMFSQMADLVPPDQTRARNAYKLLASTFAAHQAALEALPRL